MNKCCDCQKDIDINVDDFGWSATRRSILCEDCRMGDAESLSTIYIANEDCVNTYLIGTHLRMDEKGNEMEGLKFDINRDWISIGGYRGHYKTIINGWEEILSGWSTGDWDDDVGTRKAPFNKWAADIICATMLPPPHSQIAVVADPTSNVFSTRISVFCENSNPIREWMGENLIKQLSYSLS
jgi:hypothetical protein